MQYNGVDVSEVQGSVNWKNVESSGITFAMVRATYGSSGVDGQFTSNMEGISQTNIYAGVYHQSGAQSINEAVDEANHFLRVIRPYKLYYPLALNIESEVAMQIGRDFFTNIIYTFLNIVKEAKYWPMLYTGIHLINNHVNIDRISDIDIWLAEITNNSAVRPSYSKNVTIRQYSDRGSVQGISGNANLDISYVDYPTIIQQKRMNHLEEGANVNNMPNSTNFSNNTNNVLNPSGVNRIVNMESNQNAGNMNNISNTIRENSMMVNNTGTNSMSNADNAFNMSGVNENTFRMRSENLEPDFSEPSFYTVDKSDTLRSIAKKVLGDPEQYRRIMELNGLTRPIIFAGQTLRIPQNMSSNMILYRVKQGDTLWKLSEKFLGLGPRYEEIMSLNGLTTDMIYPGQILKIPSDQDMHFHTYTVQEGDTLWKIASNFLGNGNRYAEIMSSNNLQNGELRVGQSLKIPLR